MTAKRNHIAYECVFEWRMVTSRSFANHSNAETAVMTETVLDVQRCFLQIQERDKIHGPVHRPRGFLHFQSARNRRERMAQQLTESPLCRR